MAESKIERDFEKELDDLGIKEDPIYGKFTVRVATDAFSFIEGELEGVTDQQAVKIHQLIRAQFPLDTISNTEKAPVAPVTPSTPSGESYTACPKCNAGVWDNMAAKARGEKLKLPNYSCKDKCGWVVWPPRS